MFPFWSKFDYFTQLSRQKTQFSKLLLSLFSTWQNIFMQKNLKIHRVDPEKNASQTDG